MNKAIAIAVFSAIFFAGCSLQKPTPPKAPTPTMIPTNTQKEAQSDSVITTTPALSKDSDVDSIEKDLSNTSVATETF